MAEHETDDDQVEADEGGLTPGLLLDDKFRVEGLLGMGGMGAVYEITHTLTKHRRAMKLLHPQYAQQKMVVERFFREASAAGHIGNDHIIETFDAGWLATGEPYLVMEFLDGMPLTDRIEEQPEGMDLGEATEIFEQLCDGVQAAHDAGIVHRDLKPDNVFLARGTGAWLVKVLDFGVSKFDEKLATKLTSGGSMVGTPAYMSPEQFDRGADVDPPSDVYALGVILYELLTGVHPYPAESMAQLVKMIIASSPVPVTELRPDLPRAVQDLLDHMITIEVEDRIATPRQAAAELKAILEQAGDGHALFSTAMSDPRDLGLETTTPPDAHELGMQNTVASGGPPSSQAVSSRAVSSRVPESLAKTEVMAEEEAAEEREPPEQPPAGEQPAPSAKQVAAAVTLADADDLAEEQREPTPARSTSPALYGAAVVLVIGGVVAMTQLGGGETSESDTVDSASPVDTAASSDPAPEPQASATPPLPEPVEPPPEAGTTTAASASSPPAPPPPPIAKPAVPAPLPSTTQAKPPEKPIGLDEGLGDGP